MKHHCGIPSTDNNRSHPMKLNELNPYTFKALRHSLGHDRQRDTRPMWQARLSADSDFCRAMVGCGYLTREQMERAAQRYLLGRSRDGGVIFWQIDRMGQVFDGKIMHYMADGHRDHQRKPFWVSSSLKRHYLKDNMWRQRYRHATASSERTCFPARR
ncbi:MAG: hypothetical protein AUK63_2485 [bacterium P3]|nr:MAG: hypothetical protein AUK63_2485 [bacterium P3]